MIGYTIAANGRITILDTTIGLKGKDKQRTLRHTSQETAASKAKRTKRTGKRWWRLWWMDRRPL